MKRLLIPTDFTDISKNSIIYGFQIASKFHLKVHLVHVLELYKFAAGISETELISTILPVDNIQEMEATAKDSFERILNEIKSNLPAEVPYEIKVVSGHLINELIIESAVEDTELMILAVSVNQDLVTRFNQSTISAIIDDAACPVLIIPSGYSYKPVEKVLLATDFNKADLEILKRFLLLYRPLNPKISVLHVATKPGDFKTELKFAGFKQLIREKIIYDNIEFKLLFNKNVVKGILETLNSESFDVLLMLKEHESFFKSLFETGKTEKITHFLKIPMISFHESTPALTNKEN